MTKPTYPTPLAITRLVLAVFCSLALATLFATPAISDDKGGYAGTDSRGALAGFEVLDLDSDGAISRVEQQRGARSRFASMDVDSNGRLSREELATARKLGVDDYGHGGYTSPRVPDTTQEGKPKRMGNRRFELLDRNDDGSVDIAEFTVASLRMHETMDANGDGEVTREEARTFRGTLRKSGYGKDK